MRIIVLLLAAMLVNSYAGIPLPSQNITQDKGLTAGMGFGVLTHTSCKTLWTWTVNGNYTYNSFFSAGPSIKFLGGNLDSANNLIIQRYSINTNFMHNSSNLVFFIGPVFSFENTDLSALRKEVLSIGDKEETDDDASDTECRSFFKKIGSSVAYQSGAAFLLTPNWGLNIGHSLDLTFKGTIITSFSAAIAFNMREQFKKFIENTKNMWISLEYSITPYKNKPSTHNIILGLAAGF